MINSFPWKKFYSNLEEGEYDIRLGNGEIVENCVIKGKRFKELGGNRLFHFFQVQETRISFPPYNEIHGE